MSERAPPNGAYSAHHCVYRHGGKCMDRADVSMIKRLGAALIGTVPGVLIVLLSSKGFSTVPMWLNANSTMMLFAYALLAAIWLGPVWLSAESDQPNLAGYASHSAATVSSAVGLGATVMQFLQP